MTILEKNQLNKGEGLETIRRNDGKKRLTRKEIFLGILYSPRRVFQFLDENQYDEDIKVLLFLTGVGLAFDKASNSNMGAYMSIESILGLCVILGGCVGWLAIYLYSFFIVWFGKYLEGKGNIFSIQRAISYAMIPKILSLILLIPQIVIYGEEAFKTHINITKNVGLSGNIIFLISITVELILVIWTIILCIIGISETQKLSFGKSILNLLLPMLIIYTVIGIYIVHF